jgi:hypothetical protein
MKRGRSAMKKASKLMTLENIIGLVLAILIVFDLKVERRIANLVNTPVGIVLCLVILVSLFVVMNPIVGLLFLIYVYETVKNSSSALAQYTKPIEKVRHSIMNKLNVSAANKDSVEVEVINNMAPIVQKREKMGVNYVAHSPSDAVKYHVI